MAKRPRSNSLLSAEAADRDRSRQRSLSRRALFLCGAQVGLFGVVAARLFHLQVLNSDQYGMLADENRINLRALRPQRGDIFDRFGLALALDRQNFRAIMVPEQADDVDDVLDRFSSVVALREEERADIHEAIERQARFVPVTLREDLTWDEVSRVEVNAPDLPGISIETGEIRHYPFRERAAPVVGYVGLVSREDIEAQRTDIYMPGLRVGKTGVESQKENTLRGEPGTRRVEVNAYGRVIRELSRDPGAPGEDVTLTLDIGLQETLMARLGEQRAASGIVMDIHDGDVYAMGSYPSFDPNPLTTGLSDQQWASLRTAEDAPLTNKCLAGQYSPGSCFKMVVALAALEEGQIDWSTRFSCIGHSDVADRRFHCWKRYGHGELDLHGAIVESCDVYFYEIARRLSVNKIAEVAHRFGLGERIGFDLPGEKEGLIPDENWKLAMYAEPWQLGESFNTAIGQGYVLSTPLQLATMTSRLINGGQTVAPRLYRRIGGVERERPATEPLDFNTEHLAAMKEAMIDVVYGEGGTARNIQVSTPALAIGGKTGTSQVRRITMEEREEGIRENEELPWRFRDHALFVGFAPIEQPRFACAVVVEHGGSGSQVAAPICRDVLLEAQRRRPDRMSLTSL